MARHITSSDELHKQLYGYFPKKDGTSLERLATTALSLLSSKKALYDIQKRGIFSNKCYQIDGVLKADSNDTMVEAKDHEWDKEKKVSRREVLITEGSLLDLDYDGCIFVSSTGYSNRAIPYADATSKMPGAKPITLYTIRPATEEDLDGRLLRIPFTIHSHYLDFEAGQYKPSFTKESIDQLCEGKDKNNITVEFQFFYDCDGRIIDTFGDFTKKLQEDLSFDTPNGTIITGHKEFPNGAYIKVADRGLFQITALSYEIPVVVSKCSFLVSPNGNPVLLVSSQDGSINTLLTDKDLQSVSF